MADLSHLSDEQLQKIAGQSSAPDLSHLSDSDLENIASRPTSPSFLDKSILGMTPRGVIKGAANQLPYLGMGAGGLAGSETGPGAVLTAGAGYAAGVKARDAINNYMDGGPVIEGTTPGGLAKEVATVPSDIATGSAYDMGGKLLGAGVKAAANSKVGQYVGSKISSAATKVGSAFTGIPRELLETYANDPDQINGIAKDANYNPQTMADNLRSKINTQIQQTKKALGEQLSSAFQNRADQTVDSQPIIDALNTSKSQINAKLRPAEIQHVNDLIENVKSVAGNDGMIPLKDANDLKILLQEQASGSYAKNGQIFSLGSHASRAAKSGASAARSLVNGAAPEVASANDTLSQLHEIEDVMNRSMLAEGKTGASLFSAGSGENPANEANLKELGEITGHDFLGEARKIAAAKQFGKAPLLPVDATGKSLTRIGAAGALGYAIGHVPGAVIAEGIASPMGTKSIINAASTGSRILKGVYQSAPGVIGKSASDIMNGQDENFQETNPTNPINIQRTMNNPRQQKRGPANE